MNLRHCLPHDGSSWKDAPLTHAGGNWLSETPDFNKDIALRLTAVARSHP